MVEELGYCDNLVDLDISDNPIERLPSNFHRAFKPLDEFSFNVSGHVTFLTFEGHPSCCTFAAPQRHISGGP